MKNKSIWIVISFLMLFSMMLFSCGKKGPGAGGTQAGGANWWDKWGTPQYGGTLTLRSGMIDVITDPTIDPRASQFGMWMETLFCDNMLTDRQEFGFQLAWTPEKYKQGWLAESWERPDPKTVTVRIRKGIKWHNRPPMNGRAFTARDIAYTYDRILGLGDFKKQGPNPFYSQFLPSIERVFATDDYTLEYKLKSDGAMIIYEVMGPFLGWGMVAKEWIELEKKEQDNWKNIIGTGPYMLTDFVPSTSLTASKNPDYWGYDERHPENKLPYLDAIKILVIPDTATAIAALRTGKIDFIADDRDHISIQEAQNLEKTNPDIQVMWWPANATAVIPLFGLKPFSDIRVRKAMQMAIDNQTIASKYYKGIVDGEVAGLSSKLLGPDWVDPFDKWPKSLQDEYSYNPEKAKQLLKEAGFPKGFKTTVMASPMDDLALLQVVKDQFKQVGIDMTINQVDMITQRPLAMQGKFKLNWGGGAGSTSPPLNAIISFQSTRVERTGLVVDTEYDKLVDQFNTANTEAKAQKIFKQANQYSLEQHWTINTIPKVSPQVCQGWVKGWNGEYFWGVWGWKYYGRMWIDSSMKK